MTRDLMVVIGSGCSGAIVATHLLRTRDAQVVLVEPRARLGRGVAYDTDNAWHLLNSPAGAMSARTDDPGDFVRWCARHRLRGHATDFLPRRAYGRYISDTLDEAAERHPGRLHVLHQRAVRVADDHDGVATVELRDGRRLAANWVALAVGHARPADPRGIPAPVRALARYVGDPWAPGALNSIGAAEPVILLGTGLTAVDVALTLARRGHFAGIHAVSRHGLLPRAHAPATAAAPDDLPVGGETLSELLRAIRRASASVGDWRPVLDALRPRVDALWRGLRPADQDRFLRHVARYWEVHRHRMAPVVATAVERLRDAGELTVTAGQIETVTTTPGATVVRVRTPDGALRDLRGMAVVNCTGPGLPAGGDDPLVRSLLADGLARPGPLGLGFDVDPSGMLIDRTGRASSTLWTVGPLRRGHWWETTAVPEIRAQAAAV